jgi:hypothetical protein
MSEGNVAIWAFSTQNGVKGKAQVAVCPILHHLNLQLSYQ